MNLQRRVEKLEERLDIKPRPYPYVLLTTIRWGDDAVELVPGAGVYIEVFGRPLTAEEFQKERADWERRHEVDAKSYPAS